MLWLVVWLGAAAHVLAQSSPDAADSSVFNSERAGNYSFHITVDRLEVENVNFNVHLAIFLGGPTYHPAYQPPREQPYRPARPPVTTVQLAPEDYGRQDASFVLAYPLPPWVAGGWEDDLTSSGPPPAPPPPQQPSGVHRPAQLSGPPPQQYLPPSSPPRKITTPQPQYPRARPEELTTVPSQNPDYITRSEELITSTPPQYPDLVTHSPTSETLQSF